DRIPPVLLKAFSIEENSVILEFSKRLGNDLVGVDINSNPTLDIHQWTIDEVDPTRLMVELNTAVLENQLYRITVNNIRDCASNLIDPARNTVEFKIPGSAGPGDILLNEILFNSRVSGLK